MIYKALPSGASFRVCRKLIRDMIAELYGTNIDNSRRSVAHLHLITPVTGFALTDQWQKMAIGSVNFQNICIDGFTFDAGNHRIYWDADNEESLSCFFVGAAGLEITSGLSSTATVSMGMFINGELILETPLSFTALDKIQMYGANEVLVTHDANLTNLLQPGSYIELMTKAGTSEVPVITARTLNVTFKKD